MKVTFFSSVLNHHQIEFCDEMYTKLGNGFKFYDGNGGTTKEPKIL